MTPERWQQINAVFDDAQRQAESNRQSFLDRACTGDADLRTEVEQLLALDGRSEADGFLATPCPLRVQFEQSAAPRNGSLIGRRIGPYEIRQSLGSGGMGIVYLAARVGDYRQQVAIKVVKCGLDFEGAIERFRRERQVLAGLVHPNIARLLDGGTTDDGLPYLVMEFIAGQPIHRYCDANQLATRERVRLLRSVAIAVHHAHEQNVIHRDLKPANILVTPNGTPKLTDFGLAKHLQDDDGQTQAGQVMGTPSYMAPEQASGEQRELGTATDVYALGAILYELLTGRPPFKAATMRETLEQVATQEPVPPTRLQPKLPRDLETICLKCLQKEPVKRYPSARDLADDLGRFLDGKPIHARPVSAAERALRWCRRSPRVAGLLAALVLVFISGFTAVTVLWRVADARGEAARREQAEADRQRERAEAKLLLARRAVDDMYTKVAERWLASEPRMTELQREFLEKALAFYQEFVQEQRGDPQVRFKTAQAYHFMARVHDRLGRPAQAEHAYRQQMAMLKELTAEFPIERKYRFDLYHSYLALIPLLTGRDHEAEDLAHHGLTLIRSLVQDFPDEPLFRDALAHQLGRVGQFLAQRGQFEDAARLHHDGLALARALVAEFPDRQEAPSFSRNVTFNLNELATIHLTLGQFAEAEQLYREVIELAEQLADAFPDEPGLRHDFAARLFNLAEVLRETGRLDEAEQFCKRALPVAEKLSQDFPSVPRYLSTVAAIQCSLGYLHESAARHSDAEQAFQLAISIEERLATDFPELHHELLLSWLLSTCPIERLRSPARAVELAEHAVEQAPQRRDYQAILGVALYRAGDYERCVATLQNNTPAPKDSSHSSGLFLAMALWQLGDQTRARELYQQTIRAIDDLKRPSNDFHRFRTEAAGLLGLTGNGE